MRALAGADRHGRRGVKAALLVLLVLSGASPALAWDHDGHRVACTVAWDEMKDATRAAVSALLDVSTKEAFAESCTWLGRQPETAVWHHVFVPRTAKAVDVARDCPSGCALTQIERNLARLKSGAGKPEKAEALKILGHLVADLHQPLNLGFAADGGGETIAGTFRGKPVTLRAMWERELIATVLNPNSPNGFLTVYGFMSVEGRAPRLAATTPLEWANETLWLMRNPATGYLGNPGGLDYDEVYVRQNRRVAFEQLDKAGVRLAALLAQVFQR